MTLIHVRGILPVLFSAVALPMFARTITVPTQPVSEFADMEVSTNIVMHTSRTDTRDVEIHIQLVGTPTNNLEVAFGRDVNTNGVLEAEEIETVYGWRAGRYFIENACSWERFETEAATNALCGVVDIQLKTNAEIVPKRFTATCGGETAFAGLATRPPPACCSAKDGTWSASPGAGRGCRRSGSDASSTTSFSA